MENEKVYKVVFAEGRERFSLLSPSLSGLVVKYQPQRWIRPRIGRIFCFRGLSEALDFAEEVARSVERLPLTTEIWRCRAKGISQVDKVVNLSSFFDPFHYFFTAQPYPPQGVQDVVTDFWEGRWDDEGHLEDVPQGTVCAQAIKLEHKVYDWGGSSCKPCPDGKVYKVVRVVKGKRFSSGLSYLVRQLPEELQVQYIPHRWVTAPVGSIFCFASIEAAEQFANSALECYEIWEARAKGVRTVTRALDWGALCDNPQLVQDFWKGGKVDFLPYVFVPSGTIIARTIKLERLRRFVG
jgi:hypothetical protein